MTTHDLRTPVNAFRIGCDLLSTTALSPEQGEILQMMEEATNMMDQTVNNIMWYFRLSMGDPFPTESTVVNLLNSMVQTVRILQTTTKYCIQVDFDNQCAYSERSEDKMAMQTMEDIKVMIHAPWLQQMTINLLSNAVKFSKGQVKLIVRIMPIKLAGDYLKNLARMKTEDLAAKSFFSNSGSQKKRNLYSVSSYSSFRRQRNSSKKNVDLSESNKDIEAGNTETSKKQTQKTQYGNQKSLIYGRGAVFQWTQGKTIKTPQNNLQESEPIEQRHSFHTNQVFPREESFLDIKINPDRSDCILVVEVYNDGSNVPPHVLPMLFHPFSNNLQNNTSRSSTISNQSKSEANSHEWKEGLDSDVRSNAQNGLGIGLYIVRMQSKALGGSCGYTPVESGSLFWFAIPAQSISGLMHTSPNTVSEVKTEASFLNFKKKEIPKSKGVVYDVPFKSGSPKNKSTLETTNAKISDFIEIDKEQGTAATSEEILVPDTNIEVKSGANVSPSIVSLQYHSNFPCFNFFVLIVDDMPTNLKLLKRMVERLGCSVITATNGFLALNRLIGIPNGDESDTVFAEKSIDLVLCDIQMPVMDGIECVRQFREWGKNSGATSNYSVCLQVGSTYIQRYPLIIAVTAHVSESIVEECRQSGFDGILFKPVKKETLSEVLNYTTLWSCRTIEELQSLPEQKNFIIFQRN